MQISRLLLLPIFLERSKTSDHISQPQPHSLHLVWHARVPAVLLCLSPSKRACVEAIVLRPITVCSLALTTAVLFPPPSCCGGQVWPIITNTEALNISQTYHLHPGFLVSSKNATNHTVPGPPPPPAPKAYVSALPSDGLAPQQWSQTSTGVCLIHASISPCVSTCVLRKPSSSICHARLIPQCFFFVGGLHHPLLLFQALREGRSGLCLSTTPLPTEFTLPMVACDGSVSLQLALGPCSASRSLAHWWWARKQVRPPVPDRGL